MGGASARWAALVPRCEMGGASARWAAPSYTRGSPCQDSMQRACSSDRRSMLRWRPAQRAATCRLCSRDGRSMLRWPAVHAACTCRRLDMSPVPFLSPPVQQRQEEHAAHCKWPLWHSSSRARPIFFRVESNGGGEGRAVERATRGPPLPPLEAMRHTALNGLPECALNGLPEPDKRGVAWGTSGRGGLDGGARWRGSMEARRGHAPRPRDGHAPRVRVSHSCAPVCFDPCFRTPADS
jgi:hypothetical protein